MINFTIGPLYTIRYMLWHEEQSANLQLVQLTVALQQGRQPAPGPSEADRQRIAAHLQALSVVIDRLHLEATGNRIARFVAGLRSACNVNYLESELRTLRETMDDEIQFERFFRYDRAKGLMVLKVEGDWAAVISAFPSSRADIAHAVDCYASEHETACVFHLMRVLEHGLRALAEDVGKTFDVQNWQNIIFKSNPR